MELQSFGFAATYKTCSSVTIIHCIEHLQFRKGNKQTQEAGFGFNIKAKKRKRKSEGSGKSHVFSRQLVSRSDATQGALTALIVQVMLAPG